MMRRLLYIFALLIFAFELVAKDQLTLNDGGKVFGYLQGMEGGYVRLADAEQNWQSIRRFSPDTIRLFHFGDNDLVEATKQSLEQSDYYGALKFLTRLVEKREPYLGLLPKKEEAFFLKYIHALGETQQFGKALGQIKLWEIQIQNAEILQTLELCSLNYSWKSNDPSQAQLIAEELIENGYKSSLHPTPWMILASLELEKENYERALWLSLQPITFGASDEADDLATCYSIAILSAEGTRDETLKQSLQREMEARRLAWTRELPRTLNIGSHTIALEKIDPRPGTSKSLNLTQIYQTLGQP
ncbi:hypothetical protein MLD52_14150 [Puniceicoccaceae bacterium K14]|nr:hypothetical protein [Puniceicoccaceae bacterium K14]